MCRFVAYLGKKPIPLTRIIDCPTHSLIQQSRHALTAKHLVNADGFGISWYNTTVDPNPALFKSTQPAWNDQNLSHIASKVTSNCFVGHVRASTIGDVNITNCHPFSIDHFSFAHNGTIGNFNGIKRQLLRLLCDRSYFSIHGATDSEHFFALFHHILHHNFNYIDLNNMSYALLKTMNTIKALQKKSNTNHEALLNTVLTNGNELIATRYASSNIKAQNTLFYAAGDFVLSKTGQGLMHAKNTKTIGAVIVASEPINEIQHEWIEMPENHLITVSKDLNITIKPII